MKKNLIIGILAVVSIVSVLFAIYQKTVASTLRVKAEAATMEAMKQQAIAKQNEIVAIKQKVVAEAAERKLEEELAKGRKAK